MKKKILLLVVVVGVTCLCSSQVFAVDLLGPPAGSLIKGETSLGLAYLSAQMDVDVKLKTSSGYTYKGEADGVKQQRAFIDVSHGLTDAIDIFGRIGGSRLEIHEYTWFAGDDHIFDGDMGIAFGGGVRGTIYEQNSTKFGAVALINWSRTEDQRQAVLGSAYSSAEIEYYEFMLACGVVHPLAPNVNVYGGPFFWWLDGELEGTGISSSPVKVSDDIEEEGVGAYLGGVFEITDNWSICAEFQWADGASGFGVSGVWRF
jgi:hypothetical protein